MSSAVAEDVKSTPYSGFHATFKSWVSNVRPSGRMRTARLYCAVRG